jgi:beta-lactamase regulating signal transducer with metallopeptidase domain
MSTFVEVGLSNAVAAGFLAILAILVGLLSRRPALVHALWLLVLVKLVTPPLVRIPLPTWEPAPRATTEVVPDEPAVVLVEPEPVEDIEEEFILAEEKVVAVAPDQPAEEEPLVSEPHERAFSWLPVLGWVWVGGILAWFLLASVRLWRFGRLVRLGRPAPRVLLRRIERLAQRVGLTFCPEVRLLPGRLAPMIWGTSAPWLLLPDELGERIGEEALDTLLMHELAHLKRRDHWVRVLEFVALGLFWWFPITWFARRELREAEEQCCDAWVVETLPRSSKLYATALVEALDFLAQPVPAYPPLASGLGQVADLKRRLTIIMRGSTPTGLGLPASLAVFGLAALLLPLFPGLGLAQSTPSGEIRVALAMEEDKDDLKSLEADLRRKMEEIELLKRKLEQIQKERAEAARRADRGRAEAARRAGEEAKRRVEEASAKLKEKLKRGGTIKGEGGPVIRIEIIGLSSDKDELKKIVETIEKVIPGKDRKIMILRGGKDEKDAVPRVPKVSMIVRPKEPATPKPPTPTPAPGSPFGGPGRGGFGGGAGFGGPGMGGMGMGGPPVQRIENLEKKLDSIMKELEALRKELRRPEGGSTRPTPRRGGEGEGPPRGGIERRPGTSR